MQHLIIPFCLAAAIASAAVPTGGGEEIVEIVFGQKLKSNEHPPHRAPVQIPISGYIDPAAGVVFLSFSSPCGTVEASFCNLSSSDSFNTTVNGSGSVMIPAILSAGSWRVTLSLSSGAEYIGEFEI